MCVRHGSEYTTWESQNIIIIICHKDLNLSFYSLFTQNAKHGENKAILHVKYKLFGSSGVLKAQLTTLS